MDGHLLSINFMDNAFSLCRCPKTLVILVSLSHLLWTDKALRQMPIIGARFLMNSKNNLLSEKEKLEIPNWRANSCFKQMWKTIESDPFDFVLKSGQMKFLADRQEIVLKIHYLCILYSSPLSLHIGCFVLTPRECKGPLEPLLPLHWNP